MKRMVLWLMVIGMTAWAGQALATPYAETGDAGETLATAQTLPSGTTTVSGALTATSTFDADLFQFGWGGGSFTADTSGIDEFGYPSDTQLFLFNSAGQGVQANDDAPGGGTLYAHLELADLPTGNYYLGISLYNYDPYDASNALIFQSNPSDVLYGPLDPTATLDHWSGPYPYSGDYTISFNASTTALIPPPNAPVPEPPTVFLLAAGLAGLAVFQYRRQTA